MDSGNDEAWECSVTRRLVSVVAKHTVLIPKEPTKGSYFGLCTCGLATRDAVPCEHMAAIVVSSRIGVLTRNNIMPFWWKRAQWQEQFPREVSAQCFANMEVIRDDHEADDTIRYCPAWSAANKLGRPAKGKRKLSALETAQGMKRKTKYLTKFCQIFRGFSHRTIDCWLPIEEMIKLSSVCLSVCLSVRSSSVSGSVQYNAGVASSGAADEQPHAKRGGQRTSAAAATTATPIAAPPSLLPSLRRRSRLCAAIAIAAPPPSLPSLRPIAAPHHSPPSLHCHHNRCAATASAVIARPQQAHRSPDRPLTMPLPPERSLMMLT